MDDAAEGRPPGDEPSEYSKAVAKGSMWSLAGSGVFYSISFIYNIIVARAVGQDDLGLFFLALSVASMSAVFDDLGLASALARYVPFFEGKSEKGKIRALIGLAQKLVTASALITVAALWLGADAISAIYQKPSLAEPLRLLSAFLLFSNLFSVNTAFIRGRADIRAVQMLSAFQNSLKLVLTIALFQLYGASALTLAGAFFLSFIPPTLLSFHIVRKKSADLPASDAISTSQMAKEILPFGLMLSLASSLSMVILSASRLLLGYLGDPSTSTQMVAMYSVSATLAAVLLTLPASIGSIFLPIMSKLFGKNDFAQMRIVTETAQRWSLFISIPFALVMMVFSQDLLTLLYGDSYRPAGLVLSILAFGMVLRVLTYMLYMTLAAMQLVSVQLKMLMISGAVNLAACILLIPQFGMVGAAAAAVCGFAVNAILSGYYSHKHFRFVLPPEVWKLALAALATLAIITLLSPGASHLPSFFNGMLGTDAPFYVTKAVYLAFIALLVSFTIPLFAGIALTLKCFRKEDVAMMNKALVKMRLPHRLVSIAVGVASYGIGNPGEGAKGRAG
ncbi:MAG: flippase [Candidatus Paceibacterota bacterium]